MKDTGHNFPIKLHALLDLEDPDIVCWTSTGNGFRIKDMDRFRDEALPKYWRHTKMTSFQRQMNLYGFKKINHGDDIGAYYHPLFVRGKRELLKDFKRSAIKSSAMEAELGFINKTADMSKMDYSPSVKEFPIKKAINEVPSVVGQKHPLFSEISPCRDRQNQSDYQQTSYTFRQVSETPHSATIQSFVVDFADFCEPDTKRQRAYSGAIDEVQFDFDFFFDRLKYTTRGPLGGEDFGESALVDIDFLLDPIATEEIITDEEFMLLMECE